MDLVLSILQQWKKTMESVTLFSEKKTQTILCADLEQDGFSKNPFFHGIIAEVPKQHKTKEGERKPSITLFTSLTTLKVARHRVYGWVIELYTHLFSYKLQLSSHDQESLS